MSRVRPSRTPSLLIMPDLLDAGGKSALCREHPMGTALQVYALCHCTGRRECHAFACVTNRI